MEDGSGIFHRPNYITRHSPDPLPNGTTEIKKEWADAVQECEDLIDRLITVDPVVIDYFLGQNQHLGDIGRFCIAWVLLEREAAFFNPSYPYGFNVNRLGGMTPWPPDNWYRFLIHKLVAGCRDGESLLKNNVTFVTFNYDVTLEFQLFRGLVKLAQFSIPDNVLARFFCGDRFLHIYGKVREDPLALPPKADFNLFAGNPPQLSTTWPAAKVLFDAAYEASKTIRTIAPYKQTIDSNLQAARRAIEEASCIYILGYGFDQHNSDLLELPKHLALEKTGKTVMFTNFRNINMVNKNASRVFFGCRDRILSNMPDVIGREAEGYLCERSTRNVYDALADDFDSPEEHFQATSRVW